MLFKTKVQKYKFILMFFGTMIFLIVGTGAGLKITSNPIFCSKCHAMSPQVHTWKASAHSKVACTQCHIAPGVGNFAKEKASGIKQLYNTLTDSYLAPIKMPNQIPNESCEKCHDILSRTVSASGDVIIDHKVHDKKEVACVICHDGIVHGKVSEKRVTYKSDYAKWNDMLAKRFMEDAKYTRPQMETCMECHELKKGPLSCSACHETSMLPEEHKSKNFIQKEHMKQARKDILYCDTCHSYTTKNQVDGLEKKAAYTNYLIGKKSASVSITVAQYAKKNDYCIKCHSKRPASHDETFIINHGLSAPKSKDSCMTCHENRVVGQAPVTMVSCSSCHPSSHYQSSWRTRHPIPLAENQKIDRSCLRCHTENTCSFCHKAIVKHD